jgi:hypothetical protein
MSDFYRSRIGGGATPREVLGNSIIPARGEGIKLSNILFYNSSPVVAGFRYQLQLIESVDGGISFIPIYSLSLLFNQMIYINTNNFLDGSPSNLRQLRQMQLVYVLQVLSSVPGAGRYSCMVSGRLEK